MPPKSKTPPQAQPGAAESAGSCPPSGQLAMLPKLSAIYGACRTGAKTLKNLKSKTLMLVNVSISGAAGLAWVSTRIACS